MNHQLVRWSEGVPIPPSIEKTVEIGCMWILIITAAGPKGDKPMGVYYYYYIVRYSMQVASQTIIENIDNISF